ncbi:PREDICTED: peptide methionine sulfoxide reductase-like isoform X2 [Nelumbo nucifera]|uniref:peptide-methionine (S)-S-oxide reductase n=1 Tax=Nelumbo nucifera TaxID=4432 RepID=A0A1U8ABC9_NELNU|nr:PREDICTED: peptide methionine sulfoxide reductase-like isoform X2 [Nelumbo nucifera]
MYHLLPQPKIHDFPLSHATTAPSIPTEFLQEAVFAGGSFWGLEAAFGRLDGVVKTATGYCGGTLTKPTYREVCEGRTGHTEAVKVIYDKRRMSYRSLCDFFWEFHDPTNKEYLNFGIIAHFRSAIFYANEEQRKQAQESKIRRQMKLNKRIVTKIIPCGSDFFIAENQHQKYYLQKNYRLCESLTLRSTEQFVDSDVACKLNGILAMDGKTAVENMKRFLRSNEEIPKQTKSICEGIIQEFSRNEGEETVNAS